MLIITSQDVATPSADTCAAVHAHYTPVHPPTALRQSGFPLFCSQKKIHYSSRTFEDPTKNFLGPFRSTRMFKYKEKNGIRLQYSIPGCNAYGTPKAAKIHQHSTLYLSKQQSTQTGCYTIAACFPFERLEKCTIDFKDIFPGLSRRRGDPGLYYAQRWSQVNVYIRYAAFVFWTF